MKLDRVIAVRNDKTVYRDGDSCVKVFHDGYSKADVLNEALNHARIEETDINVPKVREVTKIDGKWSIVFEYIKGQTLSQLIEQDSANKDKYIEMLVDLQIEVHSKICPLLNKQKDKMNTKISQTDIDATIRYDLHNRLEDMPKHNKICHGDFNPSNIIITESGKMYIVDWAHATQGNASADAAKTYLHFRLKKDDEGAKKYLQMFCEKSDIARRYVLKWMPIVAVSMLTACNKAEKEQLILMINKADFELYS